MKINLFYVVAGTAAIAGTWTVYNTYFQPEIVSPSARLAAAAVNAPSPATPAPQTSLPAATAVASLSLQTNKPSAAATIPTPAVRPAAPTGVSMISATDSTIDISWGASSGAIGYKIFMNGKEVGTTPSQRFEAAKLQASTSYTFTVAAYDQKGVSSAQSDALSASTNAAKTATTTPSINPTTSNTPSTTTSTDTAAPSTPGSLTASAVSTSEIDLSWTASTDNIGVTGYRIYSGGTFIATANGTTYKSTGLTANSTYSYSVAAYDAAGNLSPQSASASAKTSASSSTTTTGADTTAPTASITTPSASATISGTVTVSVSASDNVAVTKVEFYVDGTLENTDNSSPYSFSWDTSLVSDGSHSLTAKSYDAAGNVGTSAAVTITVKNSTGSTPTSTTSGTPGTPTNLAATSVSSSEIDLTWSAPTANATGITGYQVFRNGHPLAGSTGTSYHDTGLSAGTSYSYTVRAYIGSAAENAGPQSSSASATTGG